MVVRAVTPGSRLSIGMRVPWEVFYMGGSELRSVVAAAESSGLDRLVMGDHVSFQGGTGFDGLLQMAALAALSPTLELGTAVYLLPLRHPVPVARQVAQVAGLAPGRFVFGIGVGGDDPHEFQVCGVDPRTRGRRMDESLEIVTRLLAGETVDHTGDFFTLEAARILPIPAQPVPIVVGGRGQAAWSRAGRRGNGWLALFVSPQRFVEGTQAVHAAAAEVGREDQIDRHGIHIWCGTESSPDRLSAAMEGLYGIPYERFARYAPYGGAERIAEFTAPYIEAGARHINFSPVGPTEQESLECIAEVARLLKKA